MGSFSEKTRGDSLLAGVLFLSYAFLIFAIPIQNFFDFKAAKVAFSLSFLVVALCVFFYLKLIRETESKIAIPFIFKIYFFYVLLLSFSALSGANKCYDPLYYLAHLAIIGLLLIALYNLFNSFKGIKTAVFFMAGVAGIVSVLGIMEYFGLVFYEMNLNSGQIVKGTFGNQNYLGGYLCVCLPFLLTLFFCSERKILKFGFLLLCVFAVFCAFFTCSRNTLFVIFLCLAIYLLLALAFVFYSTENHKKMERKKKLVIVSAFIAGAAIFGIYLISDGQLIQRFKDILDPAKFFGVRINMYKTAMAIWLDNPLSVLLGNGPGSYYKLHFIKFSLDSGYPGFISFNHVHNEALENLVEGGIFAFALYLIMNLSTLYILQKVARDNSSSSRDKRLIAISFIVSILAFQVHGLFSISTRVLTGVYTFYWITGLSWALFSTSEIDKKIFLPQIISGNKATKILGLSALLLLLLSGMKLGNFVMAETFLTKACMADMMDRPQAEYYYKKAIEIENKNIYAHYFLAHSYLTHGIAEGFYAMADRTEAIIPRYRTINYFRALMALIQKEYEKAEELFEYYDENIKRNDPLTMLWLAVLKHRKGNDTDALDFVKRYLMSKFKGNYDWEFSKGNEIVFNKKEDGLKSEVTVGIGLLGDVIEKIPVRGQVIITHYTGVLTELACLFEKVDFDLWIALKSETAAKIEHPFIAEKFKSEISSTQEKYEQSGRKKDLKRLITLYEGLSVYVPKYEQIEIRKRLLPLYLKDFQFKKYAYWKQWIENLNKGEV